MVGHSLTLPAVRFVERRCLTAVVRGARHARPSPLTPARRWLRKGEDGGESMTGALQRVAPWQTAGAFQDVFFQYLCSILFEIYCHLLVFTRIFEYFFQTISLK